MQTPQPAETNLLKVCDGLDFIMRIAASIMVAVPVDGMLELGHGFRELAGRLKITLTPTSDLPTNANTKVQS